jgi:glycosyltransferase involved in cell wall biosynthesis
LGLAQSLKSAGARVGFAFRFDGRSERELGALGFDCQNLPFSRSLLDPLSHIRAHIAYRRMLERERPDFVVLNTLFPAVIGRLIRRRGTGVVLLVHGSYWDEGVKPLVRFVWDALERILAGRADLVLTNNPEDHVDMVRVGNAPERARHVAGGLLGVDVKRFAQPAMTPEERASRRRQAGLPGCPLVGVFGRITPAKGILDLCEAADLLRDTDIHFVFAGPADGERGGALALAAIRRLGDRATYLGWVDVPENVMALCDIIVNPSHREGLGMVSVEAAALGLPVVATTTRGSRYAIEPGKTGLLVPPRRPTELAAAIRRLVLDPGTARRMGDAGRRRSLDLFDSSRVLARLNAELERVPGSSCERAFTCDSSSGPGAV